jgi:hypothetical protein
MEGLVSIIVMTASMLVIGWFVWGRLQRQEQSDSGFIEKLDADDARAREGRETAAGLRAPTGSASVEASIGDDRARRASVRDASGKAPERSATPPSQDARNLPPTP